MSSDTQTQTPAAPALSRAQRRLIRNAVASILTRLGEAVRLIDFMGDDDNTYAYWRGVVEVILGAESFKRKVGLVATFVRRDGTPMRVTVEMVDAAIAAGNVPPVFVWAGRQIVPINVPDAFREADTLELFRTQFQQAGKVADPGTEAKEDVAA